MVTGVRHYRLVDKIPLVPYMIGTSPILTRRVRVLNGAVPIIPLPERDMLLRYVLIFFVLFLLVYPGPIGANEPAGEIPPEQASLTSQQALSTEQKSSEETLALLTSLAELQHNLQEQMALTREKISVSTSDSEKERLEVELARMDRQLSDSSRPGCMPANPTYRLKQNCLSLTAMTYTPYKGVLNRVLNLDLFPVYLG